MDFNAEVNRALEDVKNLPCAMSQILYNDLLPTPLLHNIQQLDQELRDLFYENADPTDLIYRHLRMLREVVVILWSQYRSAEFSKDNKVKIRSILSLLEVNMTLYMLSIY